MLACRDYRFPGRTRSGILDAEWFHEGTNGLYGVREVQDRLKGIATFVQVVEAGSFAQAANRLYLTRSAVGKTIARLEQRLGTRLFHRTTRQLSLTDDGQVFFERCNRALMELNAAEAALESGQREPLGRLRVSAPVLFGRHCIAPVLLELGQAHPRLSVELSFNDRAVDLLDEGFDMAVRIGPLLDSTTLAHRRLGTQGMTICASPSYLAKHGRPTTLEQIKQHPGIIYSRSGSARPWLVRDENGVVQELRLESRVRFDDLQAIVDAALAGMGLAWLPCWLAAPYKDSGQLEVVVPLDQVLSADIHLLWPQAQYQPSKIRAAIDALVTAVPKMVGV